MSAPTAARSRLVLATYATYDPTDCTSDGYRYTLYADGRVSAEGSCCWQGSIDGDRWTTEPGWLETSEVTEVGPRRALRAAVEALDEGYSPGCDEDLRGTDYPWRCTRRGWRVR